MKQSISGLGTDIIEIERIAAAYKKFGRAFLQRFLCEEEIAYCLRHKRATHHLAARWAAKEAVAKALGTGLGKSLGWHDMVIGCDPLGKPTVTLCGEPGRRFVGTTILLSMSHCELYATAIAVVQK